MKERVTDMDHVVTGAFLYEFYHDDFYWSSHSGSSLERNREIFLALYAHELMYRKSPYYNDACKHACIKKARELWGRTNE